MAKTIPYLKQFVAWVTDLIHKYRYNLFYKTTTHVILLQVALTLLTILVFWWAIGYAQQSIIDSISNRIAEIASGAATSTQSLPETIDEVRENTLGYTFIILTALSAFFGLLISRFALWPTRNSLQFQKRFIGNVAHEIRTPMAIIKTNTEVELMDPKLSPSVRETLKETIVEVDRMSETINNLLTFDKLMRPGRMELISTDLGSVIETVIDHHRSLAKSRGITLNIENNLNPRVLGNAVALDQVITNLVKNAVNYTPANAGGSVTVTLEPASGKRVSLTVSDTGIGIAQNDLYHIFEPFYRGDTSRARGIGTGSSGLGLAIVNEIIRLHGGTITIRSAVGQGTTFKITLPMAPETQAQIEARDAEGVHELSVDFSQ